MDEINGLLLLTENGIRDINNEPLIGNGFENKRVIAGTTFDGSIAVIVDNREVWTFTSENWNQVVSAGIDLNCICFISDRKLLVGTEYARLGWISDGELQFIDSFDRVPERDLWTTPWGGPADVRSLVVSTDGTIYANIHVGWVVRSTDKGETWKTLSSDLEMDVHQVDSYPVDPRTIFTATADGFYISNNGGESFNSRNNGITSRYSRACACFPDQEVYLLSTSRGPFRKVEAQVYRSEDSGDHWEPVFGLPKIIENNIDTFQLATTTNGRAFVIVDNTSLYTTDDYGQNWHKIKDGFPRINSLLMKGSQNRQ